MNIFRSERIQHLNDTDIRRKHYVLYWMQQSQRAEENHALEFAIWQANELEQPLIVIFVLMDAYPEANLRHYTFMLEGLQETQQTLAQRGVKMVLQYGHPAQIVLKLGQAASLIVCDRGYLRHQRAWRKEVAEQAECRVIQIESDVVVPIGTVSQKAEYAARTIRPKIHRQWDRFFEGLPHFSVNYPSLNLNIDGIDLSASDAVLNTLRLDRRIQPVSRFFRGGTSQAKTRLREFMLHGLAHYDEHSNQPQTDDISYLSPYLHFGQISPVYIARQIQASPFSEQKAGDAFLEQLIVRRELAMNFVEYTEAYDTYTCMPNWAQNTLDEHRRDWRECLYTPEQLEQAQTHDPYWNAAMQEMIVTGFMHNYMRMYWGKKILEWTETPEQAYTVTLFLNNRYFLDGRDPNSYTGVAWIYGVHDRAWTERPIFGKIRYMTASGLERKCDIQVYLRKVENYKNRI
ncbi:MAG: deoxyribodipyrimidine photo-lyase [Candidatus Vecturithrix sp.]|jgi:deoxyribodipyrimidine photo-lyase|nr:deoxyribodipyrimidine photo-lyase [Candidatus Vecturithrix sp.]